jgi:hypothetical protein
VFTVMGNDVGVPDWLLTIPRLVLAPLRWSVRKAQRWTTDRRALVKEGSNAVTPVVQLVKGLGPTSIMLGTDEHNAAYLKERHAEWQECIRQLPTPEGVRAGAASRGARGGAARSELQLARASSQDACELVVR